MRVLGIDTSARIGAVGYRAGGRTVFSEQLAIKPGGSEQIPVLIEEAFARTGHHLRELDLITVGVGPGSYTGVRVGLAIGKGLAFGLGLPLVGVPSLAALAMNGRSEAALICSLAKSRQGEVYAGLYRNTQGFPVEVAPPAIWEVPRLAAVLKEEGRPVLFLGEVLDEIGQDLAAALKEAASFGRGPENIVDGANLAALGEAKWERTQTNELDTVLPLYLRRTEAEVRWAERSCRADV
ncbi:MAG: tRNA (adenosine(37)-N6)-threonylcarbamoyltransferase complex dimerization subunit type 1 TsaB [Firmicutes bacterium]|nr:tRNA (adenosine(37)-N6)-threonylcarbamoyltransferase complex dimerization subunit type 1 TsaB [Bacillota bacterium]